MAEESGFFTGVAGDRKYTAQFLNEKLYEAMQRKEGIVPRIDQELAVTSDGSLNCVLGTGVAFKNGVIYRNTSPRTFTLEEPASGMKRYDRIAIRLDRLARTMGAVLIKGEESIDPVNPDYSAEDDIHVEKILIDKSSGPYVVTIEDERQMRPLFITDKDSIDDLEEGATFGRIAKAKADAINAGQLGISLRKFIYASKLNVNLAKVECILSFGEIFLVGHSGDKQLSISIDEGITFTQPPGISTTTKIYSLAHYDYNFWAGSGGDGKIYRSPAPESFWNVSYTTGFSEAIAPIIALSNDLVVAASVSAARLYKTEDFGATWTTITTEAIFRNIISLGGNVLLAKGSDGKIYRSTDAGSTWTVAADTSFSQIFNVFIHLGDGAIIAGAANSGTVFRSSDYGFTWDEGTVIDVETQCDAALVDGSKAYIACGDAIYETADKGVTWAKKWTLPREVTIKGLYKTSNDLMVAVDEFGYIYWGYMIEA